MQSQEKKGREERDGGRKGDHILHSCGPEEARRAGGNLLSYRLLTRIPSPKGIQPYTPSKEQCAKGDASSRLLSSQGRHPCTSTLGAWGRDRPADGFSGIRLPAGIP